MSSKNNILYLGSNNKMELKITKEHARFYHLEKEQVSDEWFVIVGSSGTIMLMRDNGGYYYHLSLKKRPVKYYDDEMKIIFNKSYKITFFDKNDYETSKKQLSMFC